MFIFTFHIPLRGLCDMNNSGRLNGEQFALAMHLIHQKVSIMSLQTIYSKLVSRLS